MIYFEGVKLCYIYLPVTKGGTILNLRIYWNEISFIKSKKITGQVKLK